MPELFSAIALAAVMLIAGSLLAYQFITGVPPMPSRAGEAADVISLLKRADLPPGAVIYELGSGWGSLAIALAKAFPQAQVRGIELSPIPYWVARMRTRGMANVCFKRANFFQSDLSDAHALTCFLMIGPMPRLAAKLDDALQTGTPVVTIAFSFRDRQADMLGKRGMVSLYRWKGQVHAV